MNSLTLGGISIGYDDIGSGVPVLLVHGHPFDRSMWTPQVAALARYFRVVVPDLRGYGRSGITTGKVTLDQHADDIAALLDHLGLTRVVLGGLSMGGQIVLECYRRFPDRIRGLVLAATFAHLDSEAGRANRLVTADRLLREGMAAYAEEVLPKMIAPATIRDQPQVADHVLKMMRGTAAEGAAASLRGRSERRDYVPLLPGISVPTLVVVGSLDAYTPTADAEQIARAIPGARLAVIEGAGHMPNLERGSEFNRLVLEYLRSVPD